MNGGPAWSMPDSTGNTGVTLDYRAVDPATCTTRGADGSAIFNPRLPRGGCQPSLWRGTADIPNPSPPPPTFTIPVNLPIVPGNFTAPLQTVTSVPFEGSKLEGQLSYFGKIDLTKSWRTWSASIGASRSASNSSGFNGSTIVTAGTASVNWFPNPLWFVTLNGIYTQQQAANKIPEQLIVLDSSNLVADQAFDTSSAGQGFVVPCVPGSSPTCETFAADPVGVPRQIVTGRNLSNSVNVITWRIEAHAERQLSKNFNLEATASYWRQDVENQLASGSTRVQETWRVLFGFTWKFDPIPLPTPL
jgi:hypothetical protein